MFGIILTTIILSILLILHCRVRYNRQGRMIDKLPGPKALPLIGNLYSFLGSKDGLWDLIRSYSKVYYPIYRIWALTFGVVNLCHPDDAEALLSSMKYSIKSPTYELLHPWFGTGLLTSNGSKWHKRRKILTAAFHFNVLKKYAEIINEHNERLIKTMKDKGDEFVIDVVPFVTKYTLEVICEAAMGVALHGKENIREKYTNAVHAFGEIVVYRLIRPWFRNDFLFSILPYGIKQKKVVDILHGFSTSIIRDREKYHDRTEGRYLKKLIEDNDVEDSDSIFDARKKRLAMLDLLIAASRDGSQIDDEGIREEVDTFIFEGHDTSAVGICFAILLLAEHRGIQERARTEINEIVQESGGKLGITELQKCFYLERCIKESLRLYPSVPFISRSINEDLHLKNYIIPSGTICHLHIYDLHRDPNFWKDPLIYNPDRFLPNRIQGRHPYSYIPFSAGPRNCIGQKFAMMELKAMIGTLLHNFYFEAIDFAHTTRILPDLVLRPAHPLHVKFIPIKR